MPEESVDLTGQGIVALRVYEDLEAAQRFLVHAFGFEPGVLERDGEGRVVHADVSINGKIIWMHRVDPEHGMVSARSLREQPGGLVVFVDDVDLHYQNAMNAGASIVTPPTDQPYGQREYSAKDLEGNYWYFAKRTRPTKK